MIYKLINHMTKNIMLNKNIVHTVDNYYNKYNIFIKKSEILV